MTGAAVLLGLLLMLGALLTGGAVLVVRHLIARDQNRTRQAWDATYGSTGRTGEERE